MKSRERPERSIAKAITYKLILVISNSIIVFSLTNRWDLTFEVIGLTTLVSLIIYFFHERFWDKIHWGKS